MIQNHSITSPYADVKFVSYLYSEKMAWVLQMKLTQAFSCSITFIFSFLSTGFKLAAIPEELSAFMQHRGFIPRLPVCQASAPLAEIHLHFYTMYIVISNVPCFSVTLCFSSAEGGNLSRDFIFLTGLRRAVCATVCSAF